MIYDRCNELIMINWENLFMNEKKSKAKLPPPPPPQMSPYVFTLLLLGFGLWCFWDGWLSTDPDMAEVCPFQPGLERRADSLGRMGFFQRQEKI